MMTSHWRNELRRGLSVVGTINLSLCCANANADSVADVKALLVSPFRQTSLSLFGVVPYRGSMGVNATKKRRILFYLAR